MEGRIDLPCGIGGFGLLSFFDPMTGIKGLRAIKIGSGFGSGSGSEI